MSMDMVERVARALCTADGRDPDEQIRSAPTIYMETVDKAWDDGIALGAAWQLEVPFARAAIEAMREPTPGMHEAAAKAGGLAGEWPANGIVWDANKSWNAAIDAALAEAGEGR